MSRILLFAPIGSRILDISSEIINNLDYEIIRLEEALEYELKNHTCLGKKILSMLKSENVIYITAEILKKYTESDRWILLGFPTKLNYISTFDMISRYPDIVIILINSQISLLDRVKNKCTDIISINQKILEYINNIDEIGEEFEKMNIPVYKINDNKPTKEILEIIKRLIKNHIYGS